MRELEKNKCIVCGTDTDGEGIASMLCKSCFDKWKESCLRGDIAKNITGIVKCMKEEDS